MASLKNPKITVVTVLKDDQTGFLKTADSLLKQEDFSYEWVIVDGSASSYARELIETDPYLKLNTRYLWEEPTGIYQAMNTGWKAALGEYILFLNAGDFFASTKSTAILGDNLNPDLGFVAFPVIHLNSENIVYAISFPKVVQIGKLEKHAIMNHQGVIMKRSLLDTLGGFDESMRYASDGKLLDAAIDVSRFEFRDEIIVAFSFGGASALNHKKVWSEIRTYRTITQTPLEIWRMGIKTQLRGLFFRNYSNRHIGKLLNIFLRRRMRRVMINLKDQFDRLDLI